VQTWSNKMFDVSPVAGAEVQTPVGTHMRFVQVCSPPRRRGAALCGLQGTVALRVGVRSGGPEKSLGAFRTTHHKEGATRNVARALWWGWWWEGRAAHDARPAETARDN